MNYYQLFGLSRQASREQIRAAYLRLAGEVHPDRHVGDGEKERAEREKFKRIQEAYEVLRDPEKRRAYDLKHGTIPQPRRTPNGASVTRSVARPGPVRTTPGVRRDIPDDWVRGSRRSLRLGVWIRTLGTVVVLVFVAGVLIPRLGRSLEGQLSNSLEPTIRPPATFRPPRREPQILPIKPVNTDVEIPNLEEPIDLINYEVEEVPDEEIVAADKPIANIADWLIHKTESLNSEHSTDPFDELILFSQEESTQSNGYPASATSSPLIDNSQSSPTEHAAFPGTLIHASGSASFRRASNSSSESSVPPLNRHSPELPPPRFKSPSDPINSGIPRFDRFVPQSPELPDAPAGLSTLPASAYGELPQLEGTALQADRLLGADRFRYGNLDSFNPPSGFGSKLGGGATGIGRGVGAGTGNLRSYVPSRTPGSRKSHSRTSTLFP